MSWQYRYKTVTDGLVLYVDAANIRSYQSGSSTLHDISNYKNHGTLSNPEIPWRGIPSTQTVTDVEGNTYSIVKIGSQYWMAENLKTTKYNDGTAIPFIDDETNQPGVWDELTTGSYSQGGLGSGGANASASYEDTYGYLYNWYAVNGVIESGGGKVKELAPEGWRIPSDDDWYVLAEYIEDDPAFPYPESKIGRALKEIGYEHWIEQFDYDDVVGLDIYGFTALPGGYRNYISGMYHQLGYQVTFWSSTPNGGSAETRTIYNWWPAFIRINTGHNKRHGLSVRCVFDGDDYPTQIRPPGTPGSTGALVLDGDTDHIAIPHNSSYKPTDALTVSCWGWHEDWSSLSGQTKLFSCTETAGWNLSFRHDILNGHNPDPAPQTTDTVSAMVRSNGQYNIVNGPLLSELPNGWVYFTMTFDKEYLRLYINGVIEGSQSTTDTGDIEYVDNYLFIGAEAGGVADGNTPYPGEHFNGNVGTFSIHNKALSAEEILQNYNALKWRYV